MLILLQDVFFLFCFVLKKKQQKKRLPPRGHILHFKTFDLIVFKLHNTLVLCLQAAGHLLAGDVMYSSLLLF